MTATRTFAGLARFGVEVLPKAALVDGDSPHGLRRRLARRHGPELRRCIPQEHLRDRKRRVRDRLDVVAPLATRQRAKRRAGRATRWPAGQSEV